MNIKEIHGTQDGSSVLVSIKRQKDQKKKSNIRRILFGTSSDDSDVQAFKVHDGSLIWHFYDVRSKSFVRKVTVQDVYAWAKSHFSSLSQHTTKSVRVWCNPRYFRKK